MKNSWGRTAFSSILLMLFVFLSACGRSTPTAVPIPSEFPTPLPPTASPESAVIPEGVRAARDAAVAYVINRNGGQMPGDSWASQYLPPDGAVGSGTYQFINQPWMVTVSFPVSGPSSIIYDVLVENPTATFRWEGQVDASGMVHEVSSPTQQPPEPTVAPTLAPTATATTSEAAPTATTSPTEATPTTPACTDKATFVSDVTVDDGMVFLPGQEFEKTWQLKNSGTCTWTTSYGVVFDNGDRMSAESPVAMPKEVKPGETVNISVKMTAPATDGSYRGDWKLRNQAGQVFGVGSKADGTFWVKITVGQSENQDNQDVLDLGTPDWKDSFDDSSNWYLLDTENTTFEVDDGHMIMTVNEAGHAEEWGLSTRPELSDFYIEATFKTGDTCSGLDRYGMLLRAPEQNAGYVFGFSCDGRYRLYKWDGEHYKGLKEWTSSAYIFSGPDKTNRVGFWAEGSKLKLYANGNLLYELEDDTYDSGRIGLYVGSTNTNDLKIYVEEIAYWLLD